MCEFRRRFSQAFTPQRRFPQVGPWHHVGVTMEITLDKNGSLYDPAGTESWNMQTSLDFLDTKGSHEVLHEKVEEYLNESTGE